MPIAQEIILYNHSDRKLYPGFSPKQSYMFVRGNRRIHSVSKDEILFLRAESNYTRIVLISGMLNILGLRNIAGLVRMSMEYNLLGE